MRFKWKKAAAVVSGAALVATFAVGTAVGSTSTDYPGPFASDPHVPTACITAVSNTRYYNDNAPANSVELRTGGHGHGGYLRCIYIYLDGPAMYPGDHPYGKWLIFTANNGKGLEIPQPNGLDVNYQDCFQRGTVNGLPYHFPGLPSSGPNDCGESWLTQYGGTWTYQDGSPGNMYPPTTK